MIHVKPRLHIYLTGFMGAGKSTIGPLLAKKLHLPYMDTDDLIEKKTLKSITEIFRKKGGEAYFRNLEHHLLLHFFHKSPHVISVGGGAPLFYQNRLIFKCGYWIYLRTSASVIYSRIKSRTHRPLLGKKVTRDKIESLLLKRTPFYNLAHYKIETDNLSYDAIIAKIRKGIGY